MTVGWRQNIGLALASLARVIVGNLIALPFYILLLVTGVGTLLLALAVNALLLGRDLGRWCWRATRDRRTARSHGALSLGLLSAASFLVPVANLSAPIIGAAMAVHMLHLRAKDEDRGIS